MLRGPRMHRINLARMWMRIVESGNDHIDLDAIDWLAESYPLKLGRRFNSPTNLVDSQSVVLVLENWPTIADICFNNKAVPRTQNDGCYDLSRLIQDGQNTIEIRVDECCGTTKAKAWLQID